MSAKEWLRIIRLVEHARGKDTTRLGICGIMFQFTEGKVVVLATDGKRIAWHGRNLKHKCGDSEWFFPNSYLKEIKDMLKVSGEMEVEFKDDFMMVDGDGIKRGNCAYFPSNWRKEVVPDPMEQKHKKQIDRKELLSEIKASKTKEFCLDGGLRLHLSAMQLKELLRASKSEKGVVAYSDELSAVSFYFDDVCSVIMPIRVA